MNFGFLQEKKMSNNGIFEKRVQNMFERNFKVVPSLAAISLLTLFQKMLITFSYYLQFVIDEYQDAPLDLLYLP